MIPEFKTARILEWEGSLPEIGDYLQTPKGTTYAVIEVRLNRRLQPKSVVKLGLVKLSSADAEGLPDSAIIHSFWWHRR